MVYKVLIVDDSSFFQFRLKEIVNEHPDLNVVGVASNGNEAITMTHELKPDIISMDYEMPYLDGVSAVRAIMEQCPTPIIMFSSMTFDGAKITLDALDAGALDFLPKNFAEVSRNAESLKRKIHNMLLTFAKQGVGNKASTNPFRQAPLASPASAATSNTESLSTASTSPRKITRPISPKEAIETTLAESSVTRGSRSATPSLKHRVKMLIIGASTGGPIALSEVLSKLPASFSVPVVVIQHMPPNFTKALAERLDRQCALNIVEAQAGDRLSPGKVYIAPGGFQLMFDTRATDTLKIIPGDDRINYKPSLDIAFASAANVYGGKVLGVVLTGMGADGCEGAKLLKEKGAHIWAQDEASCVVYGMPKAVREANLTDDVVPLAELGDKLAKAL